MAKRVGRRCPNVGMPEWKELAAAIGEERAHVAWQRHGKYEIPTVEQAKNLFKIQEKPAEAPVETGGAEPPKEPPKVAQAAQPAGEAPKAETPEKTQETVKKVDD